MGCTGLPGSDDCPRFRSIGRSALEPCGHFSADLFIGDGHCRNFLPELAALQPSLSGCLPPFSRNFGHGHKPSSTRGNGRIGSFPGNVRRFFSQFFHDFRRSWCRSRHCLLFRALKRPAANNSLSRVGLSRLPGNCELVGLNAFACRCRQSGCS